MKIKRFLMLMMLLTLGMIVLIACGSEQSTGGANSKGNNESVTQSGLEEVKIRVANVFPSDHSFAEALDILAEESDQLSEGKIKIENFHDAALGGEREAAEQVMNGSIEMADLGNVGLGAYGVKETLIMEQPFLFDSVEQMAEVVEQVRPLLEKNIEAKGFKLIALHYAGPRITIAKKELPTFEDYQGLKLRVPELDLYVKFAEAIGASPTIIALPEVYSSLQTGVVDAYEGETSSILSSSLYEQAKNVHLTNHIYYIQYVVANIDFWNGLSKEAQDIIIEAAKISENYHLENVVENNKKSLEELKNLGVNIVEYSEEEMQKFKDSVEEVNRKLAEEQGEDGIEIYEKILEVLK